MENDTYQTTKFLYDLAVDVYGGEGGAISHHTEENVSNTDDNQSAVSPVAAGRKVLSLLLNDKSIVSSL